MIRLLVYAAAVVALAILGWALVVLWVLVTGRWPPWRAPMVDDRHPPEETP